jgi:tRNA(fMet)-specific endonuclease VapC
MDESLLDTDILSEVLKRRDQRVLAKARRYPTEHRRFAFSAITAYEILRRMRANQATRQLGEFMKTIATSEVLPVSMPVLLRASELWAEATRLGRPQNDADIIIAATAMERGHVLVTGNSEHFAWIPNLKLENWREP